MRILAAALIFAIGVPLWADTYELVKTSYQSRETTFTEYRQGHNFRYESASGATIANSDRKVVYMLDPRLRQYTEMNAKPTTFLLTLAQWIWLPRHSGKTVHIYYETVDTGERRQYFGYTARHLLLRERHIAELGACSHRTYEAEIDGWYITPPEQGPRMETVITNSLGPVCQDIVIQHGEHTKDMAVMADNGTFRREVLEFLTTPLDRSLFEVPAGFRKVDALPGTSPQTFSWTQEFSMEWQQLEQAVGSWFE